MEKDKYLSIITNFGCHYTCPYCIVKNNNLQIPKTTVRGLDELSKAIYKCGCNWVSISGGGDPLYHLSENADWYNRFFEIASFMNIRTELHTSYIPKEFINSWPYQEFDRVVYHCHTLADLYRIKRYSSQLVRAVFVVTQDFTQEKIDTIATICKHSSFIDELSFRQMVDDHYQTTHYCEEYLKAGHQKDWWYIEQNDYNLYYAENEVYTRYEDFKRSKNI